MAHKIAVIGGDGIGPEVVAEALKVVRAAGVELDTTDFDLSGARYLRDGTVLPDETLEELRSFDAILLGAVGTPEVQGKMEGRIIHLANLIENAEIVENASADEVRAGVVVGIRYEGDDEVERYLLGSIEERVEGLDVMSPGSPLGGALLGKKPGDVVSYETPAGATLKVELVTVG